MQEFLPEFRFTILEGFPPYEFERLEPHHGLVD